MRTIVCLPSYNEEESILEMIAKLRTLDYPFFVTDGGSTDKTISMAEQEGIEVIPRKYGSGKGCGLREGIEIAHDRGFDQVLFIDCDNTYPVDWLPKLAEAGKQAEMVVGARDFSKIPFLRRFANKFTNGLINILYGQQFTDTLTGMRSLQVKAFVGKLKAESFDIEPEMSCRAVKLGYKTIEIPIPYFERTGESKTGIQHMWPIVLRILKVRFN